MLDFTNFDISIHVPDYVKAQKKEKEFINERIDDILVMFETDNFDEILTWEGIKVGKFVSHNNFQDQLKIYKNKTEKLSPAMKQAQVLAELADIVKSDSYNDKSCKTTIDSIRNKINEGEKLKPSEMLIAEWALDPKDPTLLAKSVKEGAIAFSMRKLGEIPLDFSDKYSADDVARTFSIKAGAILKNAGYKDYSKYLDKYYLNSMPIEQRVKLNSALEKKGISKMNILSDVKTVVEKLPTQKYTETTKSSSVILSKTKDINAPNPHYDGLKISYRLPKNQVQKDSKKFAENFLKRLKEDLQVGAILSKNYTINDTPVAAVSDPARLELYKNIVNDKTYNNLNAEQKAESILSSLAEVLNNPEFDKKNTYSVLQKIEEKENWNIEITPMERLVKESLNDPSLLSTSVKEISIVYAAKNLASIPFTAGKTTDIVNIDKAVDSRMQKIARYMHRQSVPEQKIQTILKQYIQNLPGEIITRIGPKVLLDPTDKITRAMQNIDQSIKTETKIIKLPAVENKTKVESNRNLPQNQKGRSE